MPLLTTPRLGLQYDPTENNQLINTQGNNWDIVDRAAGVRSHEKGVYPPPAEMYDGAIYGEKGTGISFLAVSDGGGGYLKKWINYPWVYCGTKTGQSVNSGVATNLTWDRNDQNCFNAGAEATGAFNVIVLPIKAIYSYTCIVIWPWNAAGNRSCQLNINGAAEGAQSEESIDRVDNSGVETTNQLRGQRVFNAGDTIGITVQQSSGATLANVETYIWVALERAVYS